MQVKVATLGECVTKLDCLRNDLIKKMNKRGLTYVTETELENHSQVLLGYKDSKAKLATWVCKINPDLSLRIKTFNTISIFSTHVIREDTYIDKNGEQLLEIVTGTMYKDGHIVGRRKSMSDKNNMVLYQ